MSKSVIIYREGLRYELDLREDRSVLIASKESAQLYLEGLTEDLTLQLTDGQIYYQYGDQLGQLEAGSQIERMTFYPGAEEVTVYDLLDLKEIRISDKPGATIPLQDELDLLLQKEGSSWRLTRLGGTFYRNNILETTHQLVLGFGDELSLYGLSLKIYPDELWLWGLEAPHLPERQPSRYAFYPDYPDYHRSPRIIYRGSEDKIQINPPGKEPNKPSDELLKLIVPPLLMMGMVVVITLIQPRGIYILATMAMSLASVVFSVRGFVKNRKKYKADLQERIDLYHLYLRDKAKELTKLERDQREGLLYHFPGIEELTKLVARYDHRIYEKTPLHYDFLAYGLGLGQVTPSYQLTYGQMERSGQKDDLEEEGYALYSRHRKLNNLPIPASLNRVPVGYIGPRPLVLEQLQLLVMELATFHSYHDLQLITVLPEEELPDWQWMRWLPHAKLQELNVRGFVYNQRTRDQVLNSLNQILKLRKSQSQEAGHQESTLFSPHYVVLITDTSLILDHVIMEFFRENPTNLGCSLVFVEDVLSSLSENVKTVIQIKDRNTGQLVMEEGVLRETDFSLDHFPADYDRERITRTLAALNHIQNLKSSIPDTVTFLEMYGAETTTDLQVRKRWGQNAPYRSLAVPIGLRGKDDLVQLNLHEKAHGPHGLIAGTTGSGKSETLQSYILSLAVNFHPHDVGFLLIDYKGGGMAHLFKKLPHLLGTITNLDGAQSMRALVSINAEIHRRERIFNRYEVNHINQYQKKYKAGEAKEPLPHLFLISDEFAELKANQPDFMKELVSIARVGRSLGIHLILATQKPSGVVDDQIWSNSRFKLALKVADRSDSMEMLHTPDAAEITQTGRAYLQVGNNEVYELFQSAWSGADYQPDKDELGIEDHTIYKVNDLGQYEVLNQDLSGLEEIDEIKEVPTELDAIVSHIQELSQGLEAVPQPWLPPLRERIYLPDLRPETYQESWAQTKGTLKALLGMVDLPKKQAQALVWHDFEVDGNMVIFSAPGMGKSTLLQTIVMDLARHNRPDQLEVYLFDFGTNGLLPMRDLPHVADTIALDDDEKITKFILRMKNLVADRKQAFKRYGASNMATYRKASGEELAQVLIVIDSYDGVREIELGNDLEALFQTLTREGSGLGIYLVFTASRIGVFKPGLLSTIKERIALKMTDDNEPRSLVGRHDYIMEDIPGRGLKKLEEAEIFQTALPTQGEDSFTLLQHLQEEAQAMDEAWTGQRPRPIPVVPEKLEFEHFVEKESVQVAVRQERLPLGLDFVQVESVSLPLRDLKHILYTANDEEHLAMMTRHLLRTFVTLAPERKIMLLDAEDQFGKTLDIFARVSDLKTLEDMGNQLMLEFEDRKQGHEGHELVIFIPNLEKFVQISGWTADQVSSLYQDAWRYRMIFVVGGLHNYLNSGTLSTPARQIRLYNQYYLFGMRLTDQALVDKAFNSKEPYLNQDEMYYYRRSSSVKLKITSDREGERRWQ